jgi:hypothetical protein
MEALVIGVIFFVLAALGGYQPKQVNRSKQRRKDKALANLRY